MPYITINIMMMIIRMQIKDAYRKLCLQYHPDLCSNNDKKSRAVAEVCFKEISAAYAALSRKGTIAVVVVFHVDKNTCMY